MSAQEKQQLLVFQLGDLSYGLPVDVVKETLQQAEMTGIPLGAGMIKGIMNVRGTLLPVVDSRKLLGVEETSLAGEPRIILLKQRDRVVGLMTDSVPQVIAAGKEAYVAEIGSTRPGGLVQHPNGHSLIRLLDTAWILSSLEEAVVVQLGSRVERERRVTAASTTAMDEAVEDVELVVPFRAAGSDYAVPAMAVDRVLLMPDRLEPMAGMPGSMLGMLMDQGKPIPIWHAGKMLGASITERPGRVLVLKVETEGRSTVVGLAVDRSDQLVRIPRSHIVDLPAAVRGKAMAWVSGLYERAGRLTFMLEAHRWEGWFDAETACGDTDVAEASFADAELDEPHDEKDELYVFFEMDQTMYGLRAAEVKEVLKETVITRVATEEGAIGILNLRGHLITVVDMAASLGHSRTRADGGRMIVVQSGSRQVAFTVDEVRYLKRLASGDLKQVRSLEMLDPSAPSTGHHAVVEWKSGHYASILRGADMVYN